ALPKRNTNLVQLAPILHAAESPATTASPLAHENENAQPADQEKAEADAEKKRTQAEIKKQEKTKTEKPARVEETKKSTPREETRVEVDVPGHEEQPPQVPSPPNAGQPNRARRAATRVMPGGMVMRTFPDGSSIIT